MAAFYVTTDTHTDREKETNSWRKAKKREVVSGKIMCVHTLQHRPVGRIGNSEDVRRYFVSFLALVQINDLLSVDR